MPNLAQVEFHHVGRKQNPTSLEIASATGELIESLLSSLATGKVPSTRSKTVVRFFDTTGELTKVALESTKLVNEDANLTDAYRMASPPGKVMISKRGQKVAGARLLLMKTCGQIAIREFRNTVKSAQEIAVENPDHTFRLAEHNELHELVEAATGAYSVWLFVFEPNDLLSLKNKSVASAM
jgi:hypothetical protein